MTKSAELQKAEVWSLPEFSVKGVVVAGICLVTLTAPVNAAPGLAPEATSSLSPAALTEQFDTAPRQFDGSEYHGGGIYSPFSTISDAFTAQRRETSEKVVQGRHGGIEEAPDLMATMLAVGIAAGLLVYLVRVLLTI
ncbi:hypothetical protein J7E62_12350 [Variovorax paradoxus]|nr:hypothetical protein [Variovorax paradoxus]